MMTLSGATAAAAASRARDAVRRPLVSHQVIVELIGATRTHSGLRIQAELDPGSYPLGVKVSDRELAAVPLRPMRSSHSSISVREAEYPFSRA